MSTTANTSGAYAFTGLTIGNANLSASASGYQEDRRGIYVDGANRLNFTVVAPAWTARGTGNDVFQMPTYVTRVRITGQVSTLQFCQNFILRIAGRLVVNEILGSCSVASSGFNYSGVHLTSGGTVEITNSNNVFWTLTEQR